MVDDHREMLEQLSRIVDAMPGIRCVGSASDGQAAVEAVTHLSPDVVLMDLHMPRMDGVEATRQIVASGAATRVIALTALDDDDTFHRALRAGVRGFMLKTSSRGEIAHAIRSVAAGAAMLSPRLISRVLTRYEERLPAHELISQLSTRDISLLRLVGGGLSNGEIAQELGLSPSTVKSYLSRILIRLQARDRAHLVALVHHMGLATQPPTPWLGSGGTSP